MPGRPVSGASSPCRYPRQECQNHVHSSQVRTFDRDELATTTSNFTGRRWIGVRLRPKQKWLMAQDAAGAVGARLSPQVDSLIRAAQRGDQDAFEQLVRAYD